MKKVLIYISIGIFILIVVGVIVFESFVDHVQLPHGAVLHVLSVSKDNHTRGAIILCPGGGYGYLDVVSVLSSSGVYCGDAGI